MKAILVGAGGSARELLGRLSDLWDVVVVDSDQDRLEGAAAVRCIETLCGDGSSRVTLRRAGLKDADAVVAATDDDQVNLEVCRLALRAGLLRVAAVATSSASLPEYRQLQVPAFAPDGLAARFIEQRIEPRPVSSTSFAFGRAEAVELRIARDSPVLGMALRELRRGNWLVASVLRDDRLIVPHGDTVLQVGDEVTVVGPASEFPRIVRTFTAAESRFPLDYGRRVALVLTKRSDLTGPVAETLALTRNSRATSVVVVHRRLESIRDEAQAAEVESLVAEIEGLRGEVEVHMRPVAGAPGRALGSIVEDEGVGVVVLAAPARGLLSRVRSVRAMRTAARLRRPVLFSRGTFPYQHVVAPARATASGLAAARAAIDLAADARGDVTMVPPSTFRSDMRGSGRRALSLFREEAALQDVPLRRHTRQGGTRVIEEALGGASLLVLGLPERIPSLPRAGAYGQLLRRAACSVLVVPASAG
jgi:Trk K+ transport system NAD-binding subunit